MKKNDVKMRGLYLAYVRGEPRRLRVDAPWGQRGYLCTDVDSGDEVKIADARRFREVLAEPPNLVGG